MFEEAVIAEAGAGELLLARGDMLGERLHAADPCRRIGVDDVIGNALRQQLASVCIADRRPGQGNRLKGVSQWFALPQSLWDPRMPPESGGRFFQALRTATNAFTRLLWILRPVISL